MKRFCSLLVLCTCIALVFSCHSAEEEGRRKKRQVEGDDDVENTQILREYFSACLQSAVGEIWNWSSVIDTTVLDTFWYESNDLFNCSESRNDSANCWISRLSAYLRNTSFLTSPTTDCINQYAFDTNVSTNREVVFSSFTVTQRQVETSSAPVICTVDPPPPYNPNSPIVQTYTLCNQEEIVFPSNRPQLDFPSVFQFIQGHTICSSELEDCGSDNEEVLTMGEEGIPRWPYRFEALIKPRSPLSSVISLCNDQVYPTDQDWSSWSTCSVTCGGGTRMRSRECSTPGCETTQTESCSTPTCPGCKTSIFSRRSCPTRTTTKQECIDAGCCYGSGQCYRSDRYVSPEPPTFRPPSCSAGTGILEQSQNTLRAVGNRPTNFPTMFSCQPPLTFVPCSANTCQACLNNQCCWNELLQRCFQPRVVDLLSSTLAPTVCSSSRNQADLSFIVDESGSIGAVNFATILDFLRSVVNQLPIGLDQIRVAITLYGTFVRHLTHLNQAVNASTLIRTIDSVVFGGGSTFTGSALTFSATNVFNVNNGDRTDVGDLAILLTDGQSDPFDPVQVGADALKNKGVRVVAIGIGNNVNQNELNLIASDPDNENVLLLSNFVQLSEIVASVGGIACS